jgi:hypothetical protein
MLERSLQRRLARYGTNGRNSRERQALDRMTLDHAKFHIKAELGPGIGTLTVESLLCLGLIEAGPNARHHGQIGWRLGVLRALNPAGLRASVFEALGP